MASDESREPDLAHADIGIVAALPMELAPFLQRCSRVRKYTGGDFVFRGGRYGEIKIVIVEAGAGFARARRATQALIEAHTPRWVLCCGFSGALQKELRIGEIVMADSIADVHGQLLSVEFSLGEAATPGLHVGRVLTADGIVRTVKEKQSLAHEHGALAVDMESLAVAQVCRELKVRFLAVRVISDDLSADLPPEVLSVLGGSGATRLGAALGAVWKRPGSVKDMWKLRESASMAAESLAVFLDGVIVQLHEAPH